MDKEIQEVKPLKIQTSHNNISSGVRERSDVPTEEPVSFGKREHSVGHWVSVNEKRGCQGGILGDTS